MKYSDSADYMRYIDARARGDLEAAKQALGSCIDTEAFAQSPIQHAHLHQLLAEVSLEQGYREEALRLYSRAEEIDPGSLLVKYQFARFLFEKVGDPRAATEKCREVIAIALQHPTPESEDDFASEEYRSKAEELKRQISQRQ